MTHVKGDDSTSPVLEDLVTVYCPDSGYATGGGWFYGPGTTDKTSFGFVTDYVKGKKMTLDFKGSLIMIRHTEDGGYHLKSNTYTGLAIGEVTGVRPTPGARSRAGQRTRCPVGCPSATTPSSSTWRTATSRYRDGPHRGEGPRRQRQDRGPATISSTSAGAVLLNGGNIVVPHSTSLK